MRPSLFRCFLPWVMLLGLLCWGCSDDGPVQTRDATADKATAADVGGGAEASLPDQAVDKALPPDVKVADASIIDYAVADTGAKDSGPAPGFPANVTQFINMGDSIAVGVGATSGYAYKELLMQNNDTKYPAYKGKDLKSKFPGVKIVDTAVGGAMSSGLATQVTSLTGNQTGDTVVVISIGGNDFAANLINIVMDPASTNTLGASVTTSLKAVMTHFNDAKLYPKKPMVLLFLVHDPTDGMGNIPAISGLVGFCTMIQTLGGFVGPAVVKQLGVFNDYLKTFAKANNVLIVDNAGHFLGHGYHHNNAKSKYYKAKDPTLWFYNDCLHLNDKGNAELRDIIWKRVTGN